MEKKESIEEGLYDLEWEKIEWEKARILTDGVAQVRSVTNFLLSGELCEIKEGLMRELAEVDEKTPIKKIVELTYQVNKAAKEDFINSGYFYSLKELLIGIALTKAHEGELKEGYWGFNYDENGGIVIYFDLIGIGQISFHMPGFEYIKYPFDVPLYPHRWVGPRIEEPKEDVIHPVDFLISAKEGNIADRATRDDGLKMAAHPSFGLLQDSIASFHNRRKELPPEIMDLVEQ